MGAPRGNCNACKGIRGGSGKKRKAVHGRFYYSAAAKRWRSLTARQRGQRVRRMLS